MTVGNETTGQAGEELTALQAFGVALSAYYEFLGNPPLEEFATGWGHLYTRDESGKDVMLSGPEVLAQALAGKRWLYDSQLFIQFFRKARAITGVDEPVDPPTMEAFRQHDELSELEEKLRFCVVSVWRLENKVHYQEGGFGEAAGAVGSGATAAIVAKYAADVIRTALVQIGETKRERLRQQTELARIEKGLPAPPSEVVGEESPEETSDGSADGNA